MRTPLFNLDHTLDSGQVFRWRKEGEWWRGVVKDRYIQLRQDGDRLEVKGTSEDMIAHYFRFDDDLEEIYAEISRDECIASIIDRFRGLRLIRQDIWECSASYLLATYSNVPRIKKMIDSLCRTYGREIENGVFAFPTPQEILEGEADIACCRLGYRADWLRNYAGMVYSGEFDLYELATKDYQGAVEYLKRVKGIGSKVADCIALFSLDHLEACPVDVRIARAMREIYGVTGQYDKVAGFARRHFGRFAGYAQEYLYIAEDRTRKTIRSCPGNPDTHS
ncbi:MAG: DNA-3-methyladenine glycosylase family protein [Methanomassiliicoccaceae archaeon]|jgi:N-glycosylase/DNA lyase|nr:DNA-3-methyladenine glycosylase 2 family protein [Euryarchaeota archaeon]HOB38089.1 DNA glycosylase [Methanomassiliicoccaceae archaeon]HOL06672.1 DNA glycosylase [Methanomassiliicoccaceae archaeon]HOQ25264.1 DNA glycosylase [Methanomassiliicoccaceae archaeon]HQA21731.1 DNA glycosylase [Methanomassiliicoccaceae archaeon]